MPGVIGEVGTTLGKHKINIADFSLGREEAGDKKDRVAIAVVHVDSKVPDAVLEALRGLKAVEEARAIEL